MVSGALLEERYQRKQDHADRRRHVPEFRAAIRGEPREGQGVSELTDKSHEGKWLVVFFWPMDFTFVCPTEIAEFSKRAGDFADRDAQVLGVSTDTHFVHLAWRNSHDDLRT
jgi:alkyl hydroperoxide reductase subunit AhpC